jgi:hypothetical protein
MSKRKPEDPPTVLSPNGDATPSVQFDYGILLAYLLCLYKLNDVARDPYQPPIQFSITLDGADLSRNITHIMADIKINDPRAIDWVSGIPIGMEQLEYRAKSSVSWQRS